jgi:hypothetical protein
MMQHVYNLFLKLIKNCKTWYFHFILSKATDEEVSEWLEEQKLERAKEEAMEAKWLEEYLRQDEEFKTEEDIFIPDETREDEDPWDDWSTTEDEEDRSYCPLCGTPWVYYGRCTPCDRAFGRS